MLDNLCYFGIFVYKRQLVNSLNFILIGKKSMIKSRDKNINLSKLNIKPGFLESKLISEKIADVLRENIISGTIKGGQKLNENQISTALNVSRPPIREAFRILATQGLITLVPRKGAFVTQLSVEEVREIYQIRSMMESFATTLVIPAIDQKQIYEIQLILKSMEKKIKENNSKDIQKLNLEFHQKIIKMSKNMKLVQLYDSIILLIRRYQVLGLSAPISWKMSLDEHRKIVDAIVAKDVDRAEKLSREHVMAAASRVIEQLKKQ